MHIFTKGLSGLTENIESEFFRIERENSWAAGVINGLIAGSAVGFVAWLVTVGEVRQEGALLLFACLGSSSASMVFAPLAKSNSLRTVIFAYVIASLVCVAMYPVRDSAFFSQPLQCFLAVTLSISVMRLCDAMHPAAVGSGMAFIIYNREIKSLLLLMLAILGLLTLVKILAYIYLKPLEFRLFGREFSRTYYGEEMTVTVEPRFEAETESETPPS